MSPALIDRAAMSPALWSPPTKRKAKHSSIRYSCRQLIGVLINPNYGDADSQLRELNEAARAAKLSIRVANVDASDVEAVALATLTQQESMLYLLPMTLYTSYRMRIIALAAHYRLPAMYFTLRDYPVQRVV